MLVRVKGIVIDNRGEDKSTVLLNRASFSELEVHRLNQCAEVMSWLRCLSKVVLETCSSEATGCDAEIPYIRQHIPVHTQRRFYVASHVLQT